MILGGWAGCGAPALRLDDVALVVRPGQVAFVGHVGFV